MKRERASLTVEASLVVPLMLVLMLPFLYLIRTVYIYDSIQSATLESAKVLGTAYYLESLDPGERQEDEEDQTQTGSAVDQMASFSSWIENETGKNGARALMQNLVMQQVLRGLNDHLLEGKALERTGLSKGTTAISYLLSDFHYQTEERGDLIRIIAVYEPDFPFAASFAFLPPAAVKVIVRKYVGQEAKGCHDDIRPEPEEEQAVYYRLSNGYHYHTADCYMLDKDKRTMSRKEAEAAGYHACVYCHPESLEQVILTSGGKKYHREGCYHIGESITRLTWADIEANGYLPCAICVGGGQWFG